MEDVITVRNRRFDLDRVPRAWLGGRRAATAFLDNLSIFFPLGERFFIASVRAHAQHVKDEALADAVRAFTGQEAMHGREHDRYNERLRALGYDVDRMEARVDWILNTATRLLPPRTRLAATCALEHMTSLLAHALLEDETTLAGADSTMAALWRWHAAEENEHKSVAFDVYRAAGGSEPERIAVMALASVVFWVKVLEQQVRMMRTDGTLTSLAEWRDLGRTLFVDPGVIRRVLGKYLAYYRPGFHPREIDASAVLAGVRRELDEGTSPVGRVGRPS